MKTIQTTLFSLMISLVCTAANATEVYKWTDEKGVVHYSEKAPQNNDGVERITTKTKPSRAYPVKEEASEKDAQSSAEEGTEETAPVPQVVTKDANACKQAQKDLQTLMSKPIVRQGGKVMTIDDKNRAIKNLKEVISVHCP